MLGSRMRASRHPHPTIDRRLAGALAVLLAAAATAQQREPVRGAVVLADGAPWAGANVVLLSRPLPDDERFGEADEVQATSDAKGRFEVRLLPGRRYVAWASTADESGTYVASHPVDDARAGRPLELVADAPRRHAIVSIEGLDAWRAHGPISCTLQSRTTTRILQGCAEEDGKVVLPAFPGRRAALEVRCGERLLLPWAAPIDLGSVTAQHIRVDPPRAVRFRCVDVDKAPVAGIAFLASDIWNRHPTVVARSDADGMLLPLLPLPSKQFDWANYPAVLLGEGRAPRAWIGTLKVAPDHDAATSRPVMEFVVEAGRTLRSRLCLGEVAVAGGTVRAVRDVRTADGESSHALTSCIPLAPDGGFALDFDPEHGVALTAFPPSALLARLPQRAGFPLHPEVLLAAVAGDAGANPLPESLDLLHLEPLDVQVLGAGEVPADSALVGLATQGPEVNRMIVASTDRSGRVRLLLPRHQRATLCCWADDGMAHATLDGAERAGPLQVRLEGVARLRGRVVNGAGKGVPWAEITYFVNSSRVDDTAALAACLDHRVRCRSAADGTFAMPLYPGLRYSLSAVATADDDHYPKATEFTVGVDEPQEVVLDLSHRR